MAKEFCEFHNILFKQVSREDYFNDDKSLFDFLTRIGSIPVLPGAHHTCSLKFKVEPLRKWAEETFGDERYTWTIGFASGEATVKLEDHNNGTKLIYEVQANVGGKIAQVGSRLIDMTAKKMADIFFGKFSKLISKDETQSKKHIEDGDNEEKSNIQIADNKKPNQRILIYSTVIAAVAILLFIIF